MQERSQVKINVAPRREAKHEKEESLTRRTNEGETLRPLGPNGGKAATLSAPVNRTEVRQKPEQVSEVRLEQGKGGTGGTVISVKVGGTAAERSERPVNAGFGRTVVEKTGKPASVGVERSAAEKTERAEQAVRVERTADVNTRAGGTAMDGTGRFVPAEARVRVSVRTRPGRTTSRKGGGRWFGGPGAAPVAAALIALVLLLPALIAWRAAQTQAPAAVPPAAEPRPQDAARAEAPPALAEAAGGTPVRVYLTRTGAVETVPLEQYVAGVLAAEMPADFELAALKAQAIAARTFIVRRLAAGDTGGTAGGKADVNDTVEHQVYLSRADLEEWPSRGKAAELEKLRQAVRQTEGIVMTYRGQPITASFFSSSGGYTENSEDYWSLKIPYLRSVPSPWDAAINPKNRETIEMPLSRLYGKLGQKVPEPVQTALAALNQGDNHSKATTKLSAGKLFKTLSWTEGRRVKEIRIGDKVYTGREVREKLDLRSSQFTLAVAGDTVKITTYGYGHGVGMSQWGANGMAKEGYTATQILKHYYTGISFQQASHFLK